MIGLVFLHEMAFAVPDILSRIVAQKQTELERARDHREEWERKGEERTHHRRSFAAALVADQPAIVAEIKKASPSKGVLADKFDPELIAVEYETGGAAALSVLTDRNFFQGSLQDLEAARGRVAIPVLRKDFTLEECDIAEAAAHGADAVLLIAAILDERRLCELREYAARFDIDALVETHDEAELSRAIDSGATIIGVNNRNLHDFSVSVEVSLRLAERIPRGTISVSESGIFTAADVQRLRDAGYQAFLVGESLMKSDNAAQAVRELRGC